MQLLLVPPCSCLKKNRSRRSHWGHWCSTEAAWHSGFMLAGIVDGCELLSWQVGYPMLYRGFNMFQPSFWWCRISRPSTVCHWSGLRDGKILLMRKTHLQPILYGEMTVIYCHLSSTHSQPERMMTDTWSIQHWFYSWGCRYSSNKKWWVITYIYIYTL